MVHESDSLVDKINRRNEEFWRKRQGIFEEQIQDPEVVFAAFGRAALQESRKPFAERVSFVALVDQASKAKDGLMRDMGRKGGKRPKLDALQKRIREIVREDPSISTDSLTRKLSAEAGREGSPIDVIDRPEDVLAGDKPMIKFSDTEGKLKEAPVSGLKDRLSRAKKSRSR